MIRLALTLHAAAAGAYWWFQPRAFEVGGRQWFEHEVIAPVVFAVSVATLVPRTRPLAGGLLLGFWIAVAGSVSVVGATPPARAMILVTAAAVAGLAVGLRRGETRRPCAAAAPAGVALGAAFLWCAWAPPATTRPAGGEAPATARETRAPSWRQPGPHVRPGLEFDAASRSGFWTVFDHRRVAAVTRVETDPCGTRIRCWSTLDREVPAHLASAVRVAFTGELRVEGVPWKSGDFIAFRRGRMELLRPTQAEKGPFTTIASWNPHDPVIEFDEWRVQVRGWADQASHAESPTAGWGVSQAAIENLGGELVWSLASTSIGRGWHCVRTAPGTYVFEIVIERRR